MHLVVHANKHIRIVITGAAARL